MWNPMLNLTFKNKKQKKLAGKFLYQKGQI